MDLARLQPLFRPAVLVWTGIAVVVAASLIFVAAPYGRHARRGWGPRLDARLGWVLMEAPAALGVPILWALWGHTDALSVTLLLLWELHYAYRSFVYPLRLHNGAAVPVAVVAMSVFFNLVNASIQGLGIFVMQEPCTEKWLCAAWFHDPRFIVGVTLFLGGMLANRRADARLRALRRPGETGYKIPRGGLHEVVSCPNYFGEIVQWIGWAILTWSLAGASFAIWSAANLAPRAVTHHRWYRSTFPDYPPRRKALIPYIL